MDVVFALRQRDPNGSQDWCGEINVERVLSLSRTPVDGCTHIITLPHLSQHSRFELIECAYHGKVTFTLARALR